MRVSELAAEEDALARLTGDDLEIEDKQERRVESETRRACYGWAYSPAARRRLVRRGVADFFLLMGTTPTSAARSTSFGAAGTCRGCL